jgi:hypothetical protein
MRVNREASIMTDITKFENFAFWVHNFLLDHWPQHHRDVGEEIPHIPSTHLCRETSAFGLLLLESLGQEGWKIEFVQVHFDEDDNVPIDITDVDGDGIPDEDITSAPHAWLENEDLDIIIDLTADQFGSLFVRTADGPHVCQATSVRNNRGYFEYAPEPQDWSNDPQFVLTAEKWMSAPGIEDLIENLKEALGVDLEQLREPNSIAPNAIRQALHEAQEQGLDFCQPTSLECAMDLIAIHQRIEQARNLTPHEGAREKALDTLNDVIGCIETNWPPQDIQDAAEKVRLLAKLRRAAQESASHDMKDTAPKGP